MLDCIVVGDVMMDVVLRSQHRVLSSLNIEGTNYFEESIIQPGGSGNVAAAINHLQGKSALIGKAGQDAYGRAYVQDLESHGIHTAITLDQHSSTGVVVSIVEPGGHRTLLVSRGANDGLTLADVIENLERLGSHTFLYITGYSLANSPQREAVIGAAKFSINKKARIVFDIASSNLARSLPDIFAKTIDSSHIVCANLDEARVLADSITVQEYARNESKNGRTIIVKMGEKGCLVAQDGKIVEIPGFEVETVDTTGAGDAFLGSFLYCMAKGALIEKAALYGNWFASHITAGIGPRHFPPLNISRKELTRILA